MKSEILDSLNPAQKEAVLATEGPVLIFAGAGSGKTKVLTHRISHIISMGLATPAEILAVTFTNKAAGEMIERVAKLLKLRLAKKGNKVDSSLILPWMGTFHSICVRILRAHGNYIGVKPNFLIYDTDDSVSLIKKILKDLNLDEKKLGAKTILHAISSAKNELIYPEDYERAASGIFQEVAAKVYSLYQKLLHESGALDFDDLIMKTIELFTREPEVLKMYGQRFKYILVDEYQDTNHSQYMLVQLLAREHKNICVVGDEDQAIYTWRGADYRNILNFEKDWKGAKVIMLERNYRSTKNIIDAAQSVISKNLNRTSKKLWTEAEGGEKIQLYAAGSETDEANFTIEEVNKLGRDGMGLSDIVLLYRTHAQSRVIEEACLIRGIPYQIIGGLRFYERREVKDIIAYLRLLVSDTDYVGLRRIINVPVRGIGAKTLEKVDTEVAKGGVLSALRVVASESGVGSKAKTGLASVANLIERGREMLSEASPSELLRWIYKESGYKDHLNTHTVNAQERAENIEELVSAASKYNAGESGRFLEEVALISDVDNAKGGDALTLMTLHSAKGLEYEAVFLMGMEEGLFPHSRSLFEQSELEEERRLAYVGITRARKILYILYANSRIIYGQMKTGMPSRFIEDIPIELINEIRTGSLVTSIYREGDFIRHSMFGLGKIITVDQDEALVHFADSGRKRVALLLAPVERVDVEELNEIY